MQGQETSVRVLLVDDDKDMVISLRSFLERRGYAVLEAYDGPSGVEAAATERPDIIFLDIEMPGMDGNEVLSRLREDHRTSDIPVVFLTAKVNVDAMETAYEEVAQGYILKPIMTSTLLDKIEEVLGLER